MDPCFAQVRSPGNGNVQLPPRCQEPSHSQTVGIHFSSSHFRCPRLRLIPLPCHHTYEIIFTTTPFHQIKRVGNFESPSFSALTHFLKNHRLHNVIATTRPPGGQKSVTTRHRQGRVRRRTPRQNGHRPLRAP